VTQNGVARRVNRPEGSRMQLIALKALAAVAAFVFLSMLVAIALHRSARGAEDSYQSSAVAEYAWAVVPWLMMAACALPAVRRIAAMP
jgi:heme/copper-type cytochrome/quinol oxidase subunit 2